MDSKHLQDRDWQKLLRNIERGNCVLMLGADIPSACDNRNQHSLSALFAQKLAEHMPVEKVFDPYDLPSVAQYYLFKRTGFRDDLESEAENFYADFQNHTTKLHESLAQLPFSYCISITSDDLMVNAFKQAKKSPSQAFYHFSSPDKNEPLSYIADAASPLVYKLYGSIKDSRSLVLTETDLLDFLANIIAGRPELPHLLSKLLSDKDTSFLFVGFGFQRWYLRVLLHVFRNQLENRPPWSMALEDGRFFDDPVHQQTAFFYDHRHSVTFKHCSWNEFADELLARYLAKTAAPIPVPEIPLPKDAPTLFLCHSSKDSDEVGRLGEKLRAKGLNTWRDRDNLRGGEDWDRRIMHLIQNDQIDYFLVLQTPNMLAESQSYFIQEINCALKREAKNLSEFLFIMPILFLGDSDRKLELISHRNFRDLRQDRELDRLVNDILDDKQKRLARKGA